MAPASLQPNNNNNVCVGPDLNPSRTPLDHKLYRQVLLPNGLRCVLIQDTIAMHQAGGLAYDDNGTSGYESDSESTTSQEDDGNNGNKNTPATSSSDENNNNPDDDDDDDEYEEGLRDAAAALLVGVGSAMDPVGCQGLAHAIEHFLHMGSEKYPGENEYESYVCKHGGSDNGTWKNQPTTIKVEVVNQVLY